LPARETRGFLITDDAEEEALLDLGDRVIIRRHAFVGGAIARLEVRDPGLGVRLVPKGQGVGIVPMSQVLRLVAEGEADFGFVASRATESSLSYVKVCPEEYVLVGKSGTLPATLKAQDVLSLRFIDYPGFYEIFSLWFQMHFPRAKTPQLHNLNVAGRVGSLFGVMTMVQGGVGVTAAPRQCARPLFKRFGCAVYPAKESPGHQHEIYIVSRGEAATSLRAKKVIQTFLDMYA
jgi:DNA-binding transcriptional LysR family regulator